MGGGTGIIKWDYISTSPGICAFSFLGQVEEFSIKLEFRKIRRNHTILYHRVPQEQLVFLCPSGSMCSTH